MKIHELIDSMLRVQRGPSLTESKVVPAGEAGRAILAEALARCHLRSTDLTANPHARKL